jgi:alkylation response protein AidB-like acyl-CoA dehydrogenase
MEATARVEGDQVVLNGKKWWSTGIGHPNCKVAIFMGLTDPKANRHSQHSMVLVPLDDPGVTIKRMLPVFGEYDDRPTATASAGSRTCACPCRASSGAGCGFEIAQGRLGPGRIHHCMRCDRRGEMALKLLIERGNSRVAFGKPI